ncbi:hypothetical protein LI82_10145 [Methanococcoides methylutens]|uniref:DUF2206 domain-containing protein n=1 Tax=Methanococcoides methylutens TaxID=2226 RepID=A0A099SYW2_METMT|nr:DUF2206 domain-containing protein [Methanococcoides methylutens]KGK98090.1 hypothetical protein LI82_10145 [Methanococcoides methylutens]
MKVNNFFQINWNIKKYLVFVVAIQLAMLGVIGLDFIGLEIPLLRELVAFIYITFLPGSIILKILKLHKLNKIDALLYTVGLSISTSMLVGFFINLSYPHLGIYKPISTISLLISMGILIALSCPICYLRNREDTNLIYIDFNKNISPVALILLLIPFFSIYGTYLMNNYQNNVLLLALIVTIILLILIVSFTKLIPGSIYPLVVFIISISLLYHHSLISMNLTGWDIQTEYFLSKSVITNGIWNSNIPSTINAMLSIVFLAPIYSILCDMNTIWVFKIIYPFVFSLVPVGLYRIYKKQTNDMIGFLASIFFISLYTFYTEMLGLARQQIAELFLVLLILLMIDHKIHKTQKALLSIVFGLSLVVSHYVLSYIYIYTIIVTWLILILLENSKIQIFGNNIKSRIQKYRKEKKVYIDNQNLDNSYDKSISFTFLILISVFTMAWYMYASNLIFESFVYINNDIMNSVYSDFLNPEEVQALSMLMVDKKSTFQHVHEYLNIIPLILIVFGIIEIILNGKFMKLKKQYIALSYVNLSLCLAAVTVPHLSEKLNTIRLYQITLIILAPFFVIGAISLFKYLRFLATRSYSNHIAGTPLKVITIFIVTYLLFNTGIIYETTGDSKSISLNDTIDYPRFNEYEIKSVTWITDNSNEAQIYADYYGSLLLNGYKFGQTKTFWGYDGKENITESDYIYFRSLNTKAELIIEHENLPYNYIGLQESTLYKEVIVNKNKIYDNEQSEVYI